MVEVLGDRLNTDFQTFGLVNQFPHLPLDARQLQPEIFEPFTEKFVVVVRQFVLPR